MKKTIVLFLKGLWIGATMTVPGVSGGTMAIALNLYDRLLLSVGSIWKKPKENLSFLLKFSLGAGIGVFLFSKLIGILFTTPAQLPLRFFFFGAVAGGIPILFRKAGVRKISRAVFLYPLTGVLILLFFLYIIHRLGGIETVNAGFFTQLLIGIFIAAAIILPGISASQILYITGMYETTLEHIRELRIVPILPAVFGVLVGILLLSSLLNRCLIRYAERSYLIIFGFMLGSLPELLPLSEISALPADPALFFCSIASAVIGFRILFQWTNEEKSTGSHEMIHT